MFCYRCKAEYDRGIVRCPECRLTLVYRFPRPERISKNDKELIVVRRYNNKFEADLARTTLNAAGIESIIVADDYGGGAPHLSFINGIEIVVRSEDAEDAHAVLSAQTGDSG